MGPMGPVTSTTASQPPAARRGGAAAVARAALLEPFTRRARSEFVFCLAGIPLGLCILLVPFWGAGFAAAVALLAPRYESTWVAGVAVIPGTVLLLLLATRIARRLRAGHRRPARP